GAASAPSIAMRAAAFGRAGVVLVSAMLYAVPSLALFVVLPLVLGTSILSPINVIIALLLYGIALQTRVVAEAFDGRDGRVAAAADAVGFSSWQKFWAVDLPLAGPAILAGMRVVSASALLQRLAAVRGRLSLCADQAAAAKWWLSMPMASVSAEGPMPKALSTRRTSPLMP